MSEKLMNISSRLSWASYFCVSETELIDSDIDSPTGLVFCSICKQHFDNVQFMQHAVLHLFFTELRLGTLMAFEFCPDCLLSPTEMSMKLHTELHRHLKNHDPYALIDGNIVCPICEATFNTVLKFAVHLFEKHVCCDSPYVCRICYAFHSSWYDDLMKHLHTVHRHTNHLLCPYCLKHFELPIYESPHCKLPTVFDPYQFYSHIYQHWDQITHRCESCRLEFVHRKDLKLHEYLHHSGHLLVKPSFNVAPKSDVPNESPTDQLQLTYSDQLQTQTPRLSIRCVECGDCLRHYINRHFNLTLKCTTCAFTSSCNMSVNWHWSHVHNAPPIPSISHIPVLSDSSSDHKSWKTSINSVPVGLIKIDTKPFVNHSSRTHDPCGSLLTRMKRCKEKHSPPGLYFKGILRCNCGFRTIVCDQMARHLAIGGSQHVTATLDHGSRSAIFSVKPGCKKSLKSSLWWRQKSRNTPAPLQAVGLC